MAKKKIADAKFIEVEFLKETRFDFVENEVLRENIAINMQYIVFLYSLENEYDLPGATTYSVFKTITVFTASIIESLINYKIKKLISEKKIKEEGIMSTITEYKCFKKKDIPISDKETIIAGIKKVTKTKKLKDDAQFVELNKVAKKIGLFTKDLFEKAEKMRKKRNDIHLTALGKADDNYSQKEIDRLFRDTKELIDRIKDFDI